MKKLLLGLSMVLAIVCTTTAQIAVPNTLVAGTTIRAGDFNTNFTTIANHALDRLAGGTISGNIAVDPGITIDGIDIGATVCLTCAPTFKDLVLASPATGLTVGGNVIINSTGKIPSLTTTFFTTLPTLSATNFSSLSAANLTAIPAAQLTGTAAAINGSAITALNADNLASGTVAVARLTGSNVAFWSSNNTWSSSQAFIGGVTGQGGVQFTGRNAGSGPGVETTSGAFGTGAAAFGTMFQIGRNSSGGGSPGFLRMIDKTNGNFDTWGDSTGVLRVSNAGAPSESTGDTGGTVVGTQSSTLDTKELLSSGVTPEEALRTLLRTPVVKFRYKNGSYSGSQFHGIVADWSPEFAMDPSPSHPQGRSFNPVSSFGYTVQAIKALQAEIDDLKEQLRHVKQ